MIHYLLAMLLMLMAFVGCAPKAQQAAAVTTATPNSAFRHLKTYCNAPKCVPVVVKNGVMVSDDHGPIIPVCSKYPCHFSAHAAAKVHPNAVTYTQVHHGAYNAATATVTCPPAYPSVVGGGGQSSPALSLSEPTTGSDGWTVSGTASTTFPTIAYAVCSS